MMLKLTETYDVDRYIFIYYIRYSSTSLNQKDTANKQSFIDIPREDSVISLDDSYLELHFDVVHAADDTV